MSGDGGVPEGWVDELWRCGNCLVGGEGCVGGELVGWVWVGEEEVRRLGDYCCRCACEERGEERGARSFSEQPHLDRVRRGQIDIPSAPIAVGPRQVFVISKNRRKRRDERARVCAPLLNFQSAPVKMGVSAKAISDGAIRGVVP